MSNLNCICANEAFCATTGPCCEETERLDFDPDEIRDAEFPEKNMHRAATRKKAFRNRIGKPAAPAKKASASQYHKKEKRADKLNVLAGKSQIKEYIG